VTVCSCRSPAGCAKHCGRATRWRFGGDEFVILCDDLVSEHDAVAIAERANRAVHEPLTVESTEVFSSLSIGIAFATPEAEPEAMIRDADAAMYLAKERGRARYEVYDETHAVDARRTARHRDRAAARPRTARAPRRLPTDDQPRDR